MEKHDALRTQFIDLSGSDLNAIGESIAEKTENNPTEQNCIGAGDFIETYYMTIGIKPDTLIAVYKAIKKADSGKAVMEKIEKLPAIKRLLYGESTPEQEMIHASSYFHWKSDFKKEYRISADDMPHIKDRNGEQLNAHVLAWLFLINKNYEYPGICQEAQKIVDLLDKRTFQDALMQIAKKYLGNLNKTRFLAFPLCRYADEEVLAYMCITAPSWRSRNSGIETPSLREFLRACKYSTLIQAAFFAEKYDDLDEYARIRGTDAETIRDTILSDTGLSSDGTKKYDLGSQTVTARLLPDLSFIVELPNRKTMKSIPKKGADEKLYAQANADFTSMKKLVKKMIRNRFSNLFDDFLSGKEKDAESWKNVYFNNPLLKHAAMLVVWSQGSQSFTMADNCLIDSREQPYQLLDEPVSVAYPTKMKKEDIKQWQKYFTEHQLKQPFLQIWEPVIDLETVKADRYAGCIIPFYRFNGQEKHGIHVDDEDFHNEIYIAFSDIKADVERIDWHRHEISPDDCFCVESVELKKPYTRRANHQISYLDRITVWDRVRNDDITVQSMLPSFTLAQITEFIEEARKAKAVNVLAILMDYKNQNFPDYNAMDEFVLDW